jgi:hypothetical protein
VANLSLTGTAARAPPVRQTGALRPQLLIPDRVQMRMTKRIFLVFVGLTAIAAGLAPGAASAKTVQLGQTSTPIVSPSCPKGVQPSQCFIILTRTTAVQSVSDGVSYPTKVKNNGWIVSFTVGLSKLSSDQNTERKYLHLLDQAYNGTPQVAITVLKPGPKNRYTVAAQSPVFHLIPFLGQVLESPLSLPPNFTSFTALPVKKGEIVGLTVVTWAPVLSYNLSSSKFAYRQSRMTNCKKAAAGQTAQMRVGASTRYLCSYTGTRVEYSVTEITNTGHPKTYVHGARG